MLRPAESTEVTHQEFGKVRKEIRDCFWRSPCSGTHVTAGSICHPKELTWKHASLMPEKREARDWALELDACALG